MTIVVDASVAGSWILPDESSTKTERLLEDALRGQVELSVPELWIYEMLNLLLSASWRRRIQERRIEEAFSLVQRIPVSAFDHSATLSRSRILKLARRFSLSAYDASYLELADRLQAPLATLDSTLRAAAESLGLPDAFAA
ncbi:MAG: PIN domain-containing protein [Acidobacteria bacterium]|nr:MAG: PIN domain-containing protein [Acidobacteriota bacterium]